LQIANRKTEIQTDQHAHLDKNSGRQVATHTVKPIDTQTETTRIIDKQIDRRRHRYRQTDKQKRYTD
jgi:hypothetical protein